MDLIDDQTGLPSDRFLKAVREWPKGQYNAMMAEIERAWRFDGFTHVDDDYHLCVKDWHGNGQILDAMQENAEFWANCWVSSARGGHYVIEVPKGW